MADIDSSVDILMVEDNANDEALTLHELRKYHLTNRIQVVRDGQEALEYVFCTGRYATRDIKDQPHVILLDIKLPFVDGLEVLKRRMASASQLSFASLCIFARPTSGLLLLCLP